MTLVQQVKSFFDPYFESPLHAWENFAQFLKAVKFDKHEVIKEADTTERQLLLIQKGSIGIFLYKENHDVCIDLAYEKDFASDYMSLLTQTPSPLYTKALEDTQALAIDTHNLHMLYSTSFGEKIKILVAESLFIHKQNQQIELLKLTAEQRYRKLLIENPNVILRTAQIHLASYLGITPESLSRIRKKSQSE
jgi:CRP/FNR family transcriptional regulator, anaerobic regulatory protein